MLARTRYRTVQALRHLGGRLAPEDHALVAAMLPPRLRALFARQSRADQAHAVRVCRRLAEEGHREPALLQAALLHDVGKILGIPLPYRVAVVLLRGLVPAWLSRLAAGGERRRWLRPFVISGNHPALGARLAAEAGAAPAVVALITHHQDATIPDEQLAPLLVALQAADDEN